MSSTAKNESTGIRKIHHMYSSAFDKIARVV